VVKRINDHTHAGNAARVEILRAQSLLKARAVESQDATGRVVAAAVADLTVAGQGQLPPLNHLKRNVQRVRVGNMAAPPNPDSLADLQIPPAYATYERLPGVAENFLLFDSGPETGDNRILIFSTQQNIGILQQATDWYMDGTFDVTPPLFAQLFSIHGTCLGQTHPLVFALLPNKRRDTYARLFTALNDLGDFAPISIMTDFELPMIHACREAYPAATQSGCFFHLSQNLFRSIQLRPRL
jgi:hypothetical protein